LDEEGKGKEGKKVIKRIGDMEGRGLVLARFNADRPINSFRLSTGE